MLKWDKREYRYYPSRSRYAIRKDNMSEVRNMMLEDSKDLLDNVEALQQLHKNV